MLSQKYCYRGRAVRLTSLYVCAGDWVKARVCVPVGVGVGVGARAFSYARIALLTQQATRMRHDLRPL